MVGLTAPRRRRVPAPSSVLVLSPIQIRVCWLLIETSHLGNAAFALLMAAAHLLLAVPAIYENASLLWVRRDMLVLAGWSYVAVGLLHVGVCVGDILRSFRHCRLTFGYGIRDTLTTFSSRIATRVADRSWISRDGWLRKPFRLWITYFSIDGLFGARGHRFEELFHARQLVEVVLQAYQAYQLSRAIPRTWINHGVVFIMMINGVSAFIIEAALQSKNPVLCRIVLLIVDSMVDLAIAVAVPVLIILPRIITFDFATMGFPHQLIYNDTWITTSVAEVRQILVTSEMDYISSLLPHVIWLFGVDTIKAMLQRKSGRIRNLPTVLGPTPQILNVLPAEVALVKDTDKRISISEYLNGLCVILTAGVLAIHIAATVQYHKDAPLALSGVCALRVPAWFSTKLACAVVNVNCYRLDTSGSDSVVPNVLNEMDPRSLGRLIFSHCRALDVPENIVEFSHLRAFMTFNSTITSWNSSSALTSKRHPMIVAMDLILTNFSTPSFPEGIYHSQLPTGINLLLFQSNFSELPGDIDSVWGSHRWISFWIQNTSLRHVPPSFSRLNIQKLALIGNNISALEEDVFTTQKPSWIRLSNNPLERLPSSLDIPTVLDGLTHLLVENTNVNNVSDTFHLWFEAKRDAQALNVISFQGSPICKLTENEALCGEIDPSYKDEYRLDLVAPQRPL